MKSEKEPTLVEVFAGTAWEAGLLKSLLDNAEIQSYLKDEIRGTMAPWHVDGGGFFAVKVLVSSNDLALAKEVVNDFKSKKDENND